MDSWSQVTQGSSGRRRTTDPLYLGLRGLLRWGTFSEKSRGSMRKVLVTQLCYVQLFDSLWPHGLQHHGAVLHHGFPCPSPSPRACSNSCPLSRWCHPTISFSITPFSSCLLKPHLENFGHYFARLLDECNCVVIWTFFGIASLWVWNENWPFPVLWPPLSFPNLLAYWVQLFNSIIF